MQEESHKKVPLWPFILILALVLPVFGFALVGGGVVISRGLADLWQWSTITLPNAPLREGWKLLAFGWGAPVGFWFTLNEWLWGEDPAWVRIKQSAGIFIGATILGAIASTILIVVFPIALFIGGLLSNFGN